MYDMYRFSAPAGPRDNAAPAAPERRSRAADGQAARPDEAARAVQEALDRRDNGGASGATRDQ